jgi:hypothetical protein
MYFVDSISIRPFYGTVAHAILAQRISAEFFALLTGVLSSLFALNGLSAA